MDYKLTFTTSPSGSATLSRTSLTVSSNYVGKISSSSNMLIVSTSSPSASPNTYTITATAKSGYTFLSWSIPSTTVTGNETITANLSGEVTGIGTLTYYKNADDGKYDGPREMTTKESHTVESCDWVGAGHTFSKGNTSQTGSGMSYSPKSKIGPYKAYTAVSLYAIGTQNKYTIKGNSNGGTSNPTWTGKTYGQEGLVAPSPGSHNRSTFTYKAKFYLYKDSSVLHDLQKEIDRTGSKTFTFDKWEGDLGTSYNVGEAYEVKGNETLTGSGDDEKTPTAIGGLPSVKDKRLGYDFVQGTDDQGNSVSSTTTYTENVNIWAEGTPKEYKYVYALDKGDSGAEGEEPDDLYVYKTFGESQELTSSKVQKFGYTFKGGKGTGDNNVIYYYRTTGSEIDKIDDNPYTKLNGKFSIAIKLKPGFEPTPNEIEYRYYGSGSGNDYSKKTESYNIETGIYTNEGPEEEMGEDYVFSGGSYGGTDSKAVPGWFTAATKGIFTNDDVLPSDVEQNNPLVIETKKISTGGASKDYYYATGTKTGKYVKLNDTGKKVSTVYVKNDEGKGVSIKELKVKIDNNGKDEV